MDSHRLLKGNHMKIILSLIFSFLITSTVNADYVVLYDRTSKEIINIADKETDFQIASSDKSKLDVQEMSGEFKDVELESAVQDYKLVNKKFVLNTKKISDAENAKADGEAKEIKRKSDRESAETKLKALGLTQAEVDAL